MARPVRIHLAGALYHVTCQAMEQTPLFRDAKDYTTYLKLLRRYQEQFGFTLFAFILLPNQFHLCLELTNSTTLSTIMHALNSSYTKYCARRYGHTGHLFQSRFQSTVMEKAPSLLRVTGYLHTLPGRHGAAGDSRDYPWSSYARYVSAQAPFDHGRTGQASGPAAAPRIEVQEAVALLAQACPGKTYEQYLSSVSEREWEQVQAELQRRVVGSDAFIELVEQQCQVVASRPADPTQPAPFDHGRTGPMPQPQPKPRRAPTLALAAGASLACLMVGVVWLFSHNPASLHRSVVRVITDTPSAQLAAFTPQSLDGTTWNVEITPMGATDDTMMKTDRLRFERDLMLSSQLIGQGFMPSDYTVGLRDRGTLVWEATQRDRGGEMVHWLGEWDGQAMRGIVTRQAASATLRTFTFEGTPTTPVPLTWSET